MVWAGFSSTGSQDAPAYCLVLEDYLLPYGPLVDEKYIFQQDNASIHNATYTREWFKQWQVNVMKWPARSDMNSTENI
ncbi:hypothetical protein B4U80_10595 [Leptotrombidium deliense]|uniref:Tc1-like transposase DDE domain-containing protein n=1 Tax=Leptotrombidium deliense TaxID=299467 RepID=A0A443RTZ6_9ACAR|nr:hypothetical protein B4U80_10595 [Leptotrombidium deliense]